MSCGKACACPSYREHLLSVSFAPSATPSRHPHAAAAKETSKRWNKDLDAYKRLVSAGVQPPSTEGVAELEARAGSKAEVESGIVLTDRQRRQFESVSADLPTPPEAA